MQTTSSIAPASATRVNLGPLPTAFSPPSDCTSLRYINNNVVFMGAAIGYGCYEVHTSTMPCIAEDTSKRDGVARCTLDIHGMDAGGGFCQSLPSSSPNEACMVMTSISHRDFSLTQSCYPPKFASFLAPTDYDIGKWASQPPIYSPGLACPSGYSPTCTIERIEGVTNSVATATATNADNVIWSMLNDGETAIGCCPSNYACDPNSPHLCISTPHLGDIIALTNEVSCSSGATASQNPTALTAEAIRILLVRSSDPTSSLSSSSTNNPSPGKAPQNGEKIAIGVAVPLAVIPIGAVVFYLLRRRRRLRKQVSDQEGLAEGDNSGSGQKAELPGSISGAISGPKGVAYQKPELDNMAITILPELAGDPPCDTIQELHGNSITVTPTATTTTTTVSKPHGPVSDSAIGEDGQNNPIGALSGADPGSTSELGLWNWNNSDTLSGTNESSEHPAADGHHSN
ncbi:uncharacterized protein TrAtP1_003075 [Trichoderma atroviride]|uniref:Uncharacterized protein n=1 Tax=Hypocrea atroviridis (strain ATCC 20476 / IMI 206040) TaxID=452589 RepID=G9NV82_HYPAI|nr:uncharacterized protein TRIATDRAFT_37780 [Trichoderma atroviride IMI 206040]EHK44903.1 hypothetical protein TRIATDRAFT_37780 [Trichoderma atroviride IMI 206040]UKZ61817.1 hypothetical protein TrAtP1_003075 [Trichoderma atroviride]